MPLIYVFIQKTLKRHIIFNFFGPGKLDGMVEKTNNYCPLSFLRQAIVQGIKHSPISFIANLI